MAIKSYLKSNGEKLFEVYLNQLAQDGTRVQLRRRGFTSMTEARKHEFLLRREVMDRKPARTWGEWHQCCLTKMRTELRPSTVINYEGQINKWVNPTWKELELNAVTPTDVHDLIHTRIEGVSPGTRKTILKMVKRLFQMAVEEGLIDRNPAIGVKVKVPESKQAVLTQTEVTKFLREAKLTGHRFYEIWAVALFTGMRSGELYALKWTDIDFENHRIVVSRSWCSRAGFGPTKTQRSRVVPISQELDQLLKEMKLKVGKDAEFVLSHLTEWTTGEQARVTREFCQSIGITPIKFHDLRATFITQLLLKGVPLAQVMAVVGHSQIKTTNVYLRVVGADLSGVTDRLGFSLPQEGLAQVIQIGQS